MPKAYCLYHSKPLEDVAEWEQLSCNAINWDCRTCPYLEEEYEEAKTDG